MSADKRSSGRTATPPATAWCRCRSRCRCRTTSGPRGRRCSWPRRWAWTRRCWCTPSRWVTGSPSSSCTAGCNHLVDLRQVEVVERDFPLLSAKEVNTLIKQRLRRKLSVVGACIGTDAHTVGIDAILNVKGIAGEKGLEYYRELKVINLGAQVSVPELVEAARRERADAVLVSQVVTQRDAHLHNTREMSAAFREALPAGRRPLLIVGGPRFDEKMTGELGVDRIFGRGTTPARGGQLPGARADHATGRRRHERPTTAIGSDGHPPAVRAVLARPLRRQPGRRGVRAGVVRRRGHRGVHPHRRRRGAVRVVLGCAVPRRRCGPGTCWR